MKGAAILIAMLLSLTAVAVATTVIPMSVEEMTRTANTVVEARALDSWAQWNQEHTLIYTYTRLRVGKTLKGAAPQEIVVKQPGGIIGSTGVKVYGVRHFLAGEDTVLFLRPSAAADGSHVVVGLMQGNFRVYRTHTGDVAVTNGVPGASTLERGDVHTYTGTGMTLQKLESRVQEAMSR